MLIYLSTSKQKDLPSTKRITFGLNNVHCFSDLSNRL